MAPRIHTRTECDPGARQDKYPFWELLCVPPVHNRAVRRGAPCRSVQMAVQVVPPVQRSALLPHEAAALVQARCHAGSAALPGDEFDFRMVRIENRTRAHVE